MKINEIITEGYGSAILRGLGKGLGLTSPPKQKTRPTTSDVVTDAGVNVTKASNGRWYDENKDIIVKSEDIARLEELLKQQAGRMSDKAATDKIAADTEQLDWNPDKSILSIDGHKYVRKAKGDWIDYWNKEEITGDNARELDNAWNQATGTTAIAAPTKINDPKAFPLTPYGTNTKQQAQQPQVQPATQSAPVKKPRTGGKVPGQVSQTPNAQRKRAARQPQVFSSNRPK